MSRADPLKLRPAHSAARPGRWASSSSSTGSGARSGRSCAWRDRQRLAGSPRRHPRRARVPPRASTWRQTKRSEMFGSSAPGSRPASHSTWKPLQMPSTEPAVRGEALDLGHHRREARDRAGAQVVAVGEAARDDDRVDARRSRSACHRSTASPTRAAACSASTSSQSRGSGRPRTSRAAARSRSPRSAGWRAAARTSRGSRARSSTSSSTSRPTWTLRRPSKPSAGSARSTAWPCGSRIPAFGRIRTRALTAPRAPATRRTARRPAARTR